MNKTLRTICSLFTAAGSVSALALPLSTAQADSDYIDYQGVPFDNDSAVASTSIVFAIYHFSN